MSCHQCLVQFGIASNVLCLHGNQILRIVKITDHFIYCGGILILQSMPPLNGNWLCHLILSWVNWRCLSTCLGFHRSIVSPSYCCLSRRSSPAAAGNRAHHHSRCQQQCNFLFHNIFPLSLNFYGHTYNTNRSWLS